jgi:hypothetical protein
VKRFAVPVIAFALGFAVCWVFAHADHGGGVNSAIPSGASTRIMVNRPDVADEFGRKNYMLRVKSFERAVVGTPPPNPTPNQWVFTFLDDRETNKVTIIVAELP